DAMDKEVADKVKDHKRKHDSDDDDDDDDEGWYVLNYTYHFPFKTNLKE
ncbi:hypothetical protein Tco_0696445, partial [Tanacetum coccineum]